jgi:hypothetical protein
MSFQLFKIAKAPSFGEQIFPLFQKIRAIFKKHNATGHEELAEALGIDTRQWGQQPAPSQSNKSSTVLAFREALPLVRQVREIFLAQGNGIEQTLQHNLEDIGNLFVEFEDKAMEKRVPSATVNLPVTERNPAWSGKKDVSYDPEWAYNADDGKQPKIAARKQASQPSTNPYLAAITEAMPLLEKARQAFESKNIMSGQIETVIKELQETANSIKIKESILNPPQKPVFSPGRRSGQGIRTK